MLSSTARLLSRHGAVLVGDDVRRSGSSRRWSWIAVGASVGFGMSFLEGLYLVALASVFALIPSGPGYAGTQDAATVIGIKAIGGTRRDRRVLPRDAALRPARPDHRGRLPAARSPATAGSRGPGRRAREAAARAARSSPTPCSSRVALGLRLYDLGDRPFHHDESQDAYFSWILYTKGDYAYNPLLHGPLRFYLTASMYALFGDSDFTARLAPALMGTAMVAMPYFLRRQLGHVAAFTAAVLLAIGPVLPVLLALRPRGHLLRGDQPRAAGGRVPLPRRAAALAPGADRGADRARLRDEGDDVHRGLRGVHVLRDPARARGPRRADARAPCARSAGRRGCGRSRPSRRPSR